MSGAYWTAVDSPVGELLLTADDAALTGVAFTPFTAPPSGLAPDHPVLAAAGRQLAEYFAGRREDFDLPLAARGSAFRQRVWAHLRQVPYGTTTTYAAVASTLGLSSGWARAVGHANGANPIAVVPCHRVVGSNGRLTGYAGGLDRKRALLALEHTALC